MTNPSEKLPVRIRVCHVLPTGEAVKTARLSYALSELTPEQAELLTAWTDDLGARVGEPDAQFPQNISLELSVEGEVGRREYRYPSGHRPVAAILPLFKLDR